MANAFDQFDTPNAFDKFDAPATPTQAAPAPSRGFIDQAGDFASAAWHNTVKPFHSMALTVQHGIDSALDAVDPNYQKGLSYLVTGVPTRSGWNQAWHNTTASDDAAMKKWEADYQASTPDNAASYTGATVGTVLPFLASSVGKGLQYVGDTAASFVPKFLGGGSEAVAASKLAAEAGGKALPFIPKVVSGAAQGGALSFLTSPGSGSGSYWENKLDDARNGALVGGLLPVGGALVRGGYNVVKPFVNPNGIVSDALKTWIPGGAAALNDAKELVPGSLPTTAQVAANPEIAAAEKTLANNPAYKPLFDARANANNDARLAVVNGIAKTPADLEAAIAERTAATAPWRDAAFQVPATPVWRQNLTDAGSQIKQVLDKAPRMSGADFDALQQAKTWIGSAQRGNMDSQTLYNNLASLQVTSKAATAAIQGAGGALKNSGNLVDAAPVMKQIQNLQLSALGTDPIVKRGAADLLKSIQEGIANTGEGATLIRPDLLDGYRQNVKNILKQYASNGAVGTKQEAAFEPIRGAIVGAIDRANPGYSDYLGTFARKSVPINTMEAGQSILANLDGSAANSGGAAQITLPKINSFLKQATSGPYGVAPDAEAALKGIQADLQRASISNSVKSAGSDTAYNLQAPGWLGKMLYGDNFQGGKIAPAIGGLLGFSSGGPAGAIGGFVGGKSLAGMASKRVNDVLAEALLNPAKAQALMQEAKTNPALMKLLQSAPQAGLLFGNRAAGLLGNAETKPVSAGGLLDTPAW